MTLLQYADFQRIHAIKKPSSADELTLKTYYKQMATETLPALPKGSNGPSSTAPDKA